MFAPDWSLGVFRDGLGNDVGHRIFMFDFVKMTWPDLDNVICIDFVVKGDVPPLASTILLWSRDSRGVVVGLSSRVAPSGSYTPQVRYFFVL